MTAHQLAQVLLSGEDVEVVIRPGPSDWISGIISVRPASYKSFLREPEEGREGAIVLSTGLESLNHDEDLIYND
jgi:hypothetical protein